ncbi:MAG TPA: nucleotidyltransferase [candidate division Zixibacteria bacterium]|nr:nucleotidyltransferase [candidate division Zixibacteria bacterium]MDD4918011.1 nucleotidyltransferase [candidate division Zixibacteria bacterium]MDM7972437.1 nucleotidyltransferase [candidate division Zixibacteria bacterium]HPM38250.1 nucleotidyltransferase [candidate division Zixibacteria bacterium]
MSTNDNIPMNEVLSQMAAELDISETDFNKAVGHYEAIGDWLGRDGSSIAVLKPNIYSHGSFRLGTIVRPIGDDPEYDIDLVCRLEVNSQNTKPAQLKRLVGDRLRENERYRDILVEKNRCWQIKYAGAFHLDILPATPDGQMGSDAILIPDKRLSCWKCSNPKGYAVWFMNRMRPQFESQRKALAAARGVHIDQVPEFSVKTPLQKAIQLLKRHRDIRFGGHQWEEAKPISMIITTLAALAYLGEPDVHSALTNIVDALAAYTPLLAHGQVRERFAGERILTRDAGGRWYIPNPINPAENFADKWHEADNLGARAFFQWIQWIKADLTALGMPNRTENEKVLQKAFGASVANKVMESYNQPAVPQFRISHPSKPWSPR